MPRLSLNILVPAVTVATLVVGSTIAWSNIALSKNASLKGALVTRNPVIQSSPAVPDFDAVVVNRTGKADRETVSRPAVKSDFNQAFADATFTSRRDNKPAKREKLRNTGWSRIAGTR